MYTPLFYILLEFTKRMDQGQDKDYRRTTQGTHRQCTVRVHQTLRRKKDYHKNQGIQLL